VNNPRARMKGSSSSSYKIVSSNSSRNNSCNRCSSFRSSEKMSNRKSKQSSNKESERRWPLKIIRYYTSMDHDEVEQLDPEIEADLRLFIG
jgi:ribosome-binding protein aMBF1 (putative translation factor)